MDSCLQRLVEAMNDPLLAEARTGEEKRSSVPSLIHDIIAQAFRGRTYIEEDENSDIARPVAREVRKSEAVDLKPFLTEKVILKRGLTLLKGRISTAEVLGTDQTNSDLVPGKYEGGLKLWECTIDLIEAVRREIQDGHLAFRGKDVLELGCGHGLPGILACLKGASQVHFQDYNEEVLLNLTIPNVNANLTAASEKALKLSSDLDSSGMKSPGPSSETRFFAGDWGDMASLLSLPPFPRQSEEEEEEERLSNASGREGGGASGQSQTSGPLEAYHRKLSGTPSFYNRKEGLEGKEGGGYDIILMSETVYSPHSLPRLLTLIKQCLRRPYGVVYLAGKKHYFGVGGGTRQFRSLVEEDGNLHSHLVKEWADGSSNVREIWKFFFKS